MTCDGKTMTMTVRETVAIEHATGGEDLTGEERPWVVGAVWLAMTHRTVYRWRTGKEETPHPDARVERHLRRERIIAYGADA